jgi:hypothetical protein
MKLNAHRDLVMPVLEKMNTPILRGMQIYHKYSESDYLCVDAVSCAGNMQWLQEAV